LAAVLLAAAPRPATQTVYSAPAILRAAGASTTDPIDAVLADGRIAAPIGSSTFVGTNPFGVTLTPDGRFAIVANAEQNAIGPSTQPAQAADLVAGYSLTVVDAKTMRVASIYRAAGVGFSGGVASLRDPQNPARTLVLASDGPNDVVRVFDIGDDGTLVPEPSTIAMSSRGFPNLIVVSANATRAYVTNERDDSVTAIDVGARRALGIASTGFAPHGVAADATRVFVSNEGFAGYSALAASARAPSFSNVATDETRASSLSVFSLDRSGGFAAGASGVVRLDPLPDGVDTVGGAHPNAVVVRRDGAYAYVSLSNVDRVATVALDGDPRVVGGLDLRFFVDSPYGTQPGAEALSNDGKRLYVALAGLNAVAVLDAREPAKLHRLGLLPTGAFPSALALSPDGRYLFVTSADGVDGWGQLQRVDLKKLPLMKSTLSALRYNRTASAARPNPVVPPLTGDAKSDAIDRVITIAVGAGTFDAFLGDLGRGNGDPSLCEFGQSVTPNLHALAGSYAIADNFYADDLRDDINRLYGFGGVDTPYVHRTLATNAARFPYDAHGQDPIDYPRTGYLFSALARANLSYRDYGGLVNLSGYIPSIPQAPRRGRTSESSGLGGTYTLDVPGLAVLDQHVDEAYPAWNPAISDVARANEFVRDMGNLVASDQQPAYTYVWLPSVGGAAAATDADRALGTIVAFLSRTPHWSSTAVFIVADGTGGTRDHVNGARTFALVVSPLAKAQYVGRLHLSSASVVKTEEELLGLRPIGLADLLATDMADFFGEVPYPNIYQATP
jgi:DNA-binding beta-propeller fold protein YncE